ncbi:MAG: hypothetical protein WD066_15550 [Planctomycetaceae bacterium]
MAIEIDFRNLYVAQMDDLGDPNRLPLASLNDNDTHIHGTLRIRIGSRDLPMLGFFGPDDACLGAWAAELSAASRALSEQDPARFVYDEGEQGQPAFVFDRRSKEIRVSIADSETSGGRGIPEWGVQVCGLAEFFAAVEKFLNQLHVVICEGSAEAGKNWLDEQLRRRG